MLEHTPPQEFVPSVQPTITYQAPPALSPQRQAQVEAHIAYLCSRAAADHPQRSVTDLRLEMELRLAELVRAHQELGNDLDAATIAALQQLRREYASPVTVAQVQKRVGLFGKHPWLKSASLPLSLFSLFYIADGTRFAWRVWTQLFGTAAADAPFYRFELFAVPLLVGLITGGALRKRAGHAVLTSLALLAVVAILLPGFVYGLAITNMLEHVPTWMQIPSWTPGASFVPGATGATFWIALGYGGAQLGSWLRDRLPLLAANRSNSKQ